MNSGINNFNPNTTFASTQLGGSGTSANVGSSSQAQLLDDIAHILLDVASDMQPQTSGPSSGDGAPSSGGMPFGSGMQSPTSMSAGGSMPFGSNMQPPMRVPPSGSMPFGSGAPTAASADQGSSGTAQAQLSSVNFQMPGLSDGVGLLQGPVNPDGSRDLYSSGSDGKGIDHRAVLEADGSIKFDNFNAMNKVVNLNGRGQGPVNANSDGTYTIPKGGATLTAPDISTS